MNRVSILNLMLILLVAVSFVQAQSTIPNYHQYTEFLFASPGAYGNGLLGYVNPANLNYLHGMDTRIFFSTEKDNMESIERWGFFSSSPHLGFGMIHQDDLSDYRFSMGFGSDGFSFGMGYGWSSGSLADLYRDKLITVGSIIRPLRHVSVGMGGTFALNSDDREGLFELGVRPLGSDLFTLFGDFSLQTKDRLDDGAWSAGVVFQPLTGIHLPGRYLDSKAFMDGLSVSFGTNGISSQAHISDNSDFDRLHYGFRFGALEHNIFDQLFTKGKKYLSMELKGKVDYRKYALFDEDNHFLIEILDTLEGVNNDPSVAGGVINLSDSYISRELAWEIREKL